MELVKDEEKIKELESIVIKQKYEGSNVITDKNKIKELENISNIKAQKEKEKPNAFVKFTKDFYTDNISGSSTF